MLTFSERAEIFTAFFRWIWGTDRESKQCTGVHIFYSSCA